MGKDLPQIIVHFFHNLLLSQDQNKKSLATTEIMPI